MEPWLLFFDIDGTLLDNDTNRVPESTVKALKKAQAVGLVSLLAGFIGLW